ncbi:unnamed protein product [Caenorhabditis angaria]|uniref:Uncharacterized protein n=1 Tax=Caenorhabditis angaria TaxID=860376 RepID=A0A9P1NCK1_9PELO|nr:unnamed protein product [Caenorhabditis angaria]
MQNIINFYCGDENLTEEELEKIVQSLNFNSEKADVICLTLNGNVPFYKKSIMSTILEKTQMARIVYIDGNYYDERDFDEADYEGIELFLKAGSSNPRRRIRLSLETSRDFCDKLVELSHKWFGHGETSPYAIRNGENILIFREYIY